MARLDFEKPIIDLEIKIEELKKLGSDKMIDLSPEIKKLQQKLEKMKEDIYNNLSDWQRVQIARHPDRPYTTASSRRPPRGPARTSCPR